MFEELITKGEQTAAQLTVKAAAQMATQLTVQTAAQMAAQLIAESAAQMATISSHRCLAICLVSRI